jgi:hypothetical protein
MRQSVTHVTVLFCRKGVDKGLVVCTVEIEREHKKALSTNLKKDTVMTTSSAPKHKTRKPRLTARQRRIDAAGFPAIKAAVDALSRYERRQLRDEHPEGAFDRAERWYPTAREDGGHISGCIRPPSRARPYSYMLACRSLSHCEDLESADHELVLDVRREAKALGIESFNGEDKGALLAHLAHLLDGVLPEATQPARARARL